MTTLSGKAAIVTGGGTGVGKATALRLAQEGCHVLVNYSRSKEESEETAKEVRALGVKCLVYQADVADDGACRAMAAAAEKEFGRIDFLVNSAGTTKFIAADDLEAVTDDVWLRLYQVNVLGPFHCIRAVKEPMLRAGGGAIVNVSSVAARTANGSSIAYCCTKAALDNLTISMARTLAPKIRVNGVAPGLISSRWVAQNLGQAAWEKTLKTSEEKTPLGRVCSPDDVAAAIMSFITGSQLITGQTIVVDGGMIIAAPAMMRR
ncbi:MAG: SDR family oxidoreductase [Planctomycetales bacterium]|nr:SDR family oxidoreductase [Planctomycetales bacterium]